MIRVLLLSSKPERAQMIIFYWRHQLRRGELSSGALHCVVTL